MCSVFEGLKMKKYTLPILLAVGLAGCGFDKAPPSQQEVEQPKPVPGSERAVASTAALSPDAPGTKRDVLEEFSERLIRDGRGKFRFDRIRDAKGGGRERQVYVEMIGLNDQQSAQLVSEVMESLGFKAGYSFGDENGIRLSFTLKNTPLTRVLVRTREAHSNLNDPSAMSSVYLTQPTTGK